MTEASSPSVPALYERRDVNILGILAAAGSLVVMAVLVHLAAWWVFDNLQARERALKHSTFPLAAEQRGRLPKEPHLEQLDRMAGTNDSGKLYVAEQERLQSYGWVDEKAEIVHIPIEQAMKAIVEQNRLRTRGERGQR